MVSLSGFRRELDVPPGLAYLNNAATSPTPRFVRRAMAAFEDDRARRVEGAWDDWLVAVDGARASTARFFGARPEEVAFLSNTGHGLNTVAAMLPWRRGDTVVTTDLEFPSNILPWRRLRSRGVRVKVVASRGGRLEPEELYAAMDDRTRLVTVSWVSFRNGQRLPVKEIARQAHRHGAYLLVDAIQGAGALRPDFRGSGADFLACGGHKWLMAPFGIGAFLVRRDLVAQFEPPYVGWFGRADPEDYSPNNDRWASTARRFEIGNLNFGGIAGWRAAVEGLDALGGLERSCLERARRLMDVLTGQGLAVVTPSERDEHASIVCVSVRRPQEAVRALERRHVHASVRGKWVRLSPHFWASDEELDRAVGVLARHAGTARAARAPRLQKR